MDRDRQMLGEFFRELAVLWLAFSPLDAALSSEPAKPSAILFFLSFGLLSLAIGLWLGQDGS